MAWTGRARATILVCVEVREKTWSSEATPGLPDGQSLSPGSGARRSEPAQEADAGPSAAQASNDAAVGGTTAELEPGSARTVLEDEPAGFSPNGYLKRMLEYEITHKPLPPYRIVHSALLRVAKP